MAMLLLLYQAMRFVDVLVLSALTTARIAGEYAAMSMVAQLISIYPNAISQTLGPRIAALYAAGDRDGMYREFRQYLRQASLLGGYLFGGIAVFGTDLDLLFGPEFHFPVMLAGLLALGWYISAVLAPLGYALSMTGRHRQEFVILASGAGVLLAALFAFVPLLGGVGAALAVALSFLVINVVRSVRVIRVLGRNPLSARDLLPPLLFLGLAALASTLDQVVAGRSIALLLVECVAYTLLSAAAYGFLLAVPAERRRIGSMLARVGARA